MIDEALNLTGPEIGYVKLFQNKVDHPIIGFHCIIYQQVLCAKFRTK